MIPARVATAGVPAAARRAPCHRPLKASTLAACLAGLLMALAGCGPGQGPELKRFAGRAQGTTYHVSYVSAKDMAVVRQAVQDELDQFDLEFSLWLEDSTIRRFNSHRSTGPFEGGRRFVSVVQRALEIAERTDGIFDPTIYPLIAALGFGPEPSAGQDEERLAAARSLIGYRKLSVLDETHLAKSDPLVEIDLNAFAPGVAVDGLGERLRGFGISSFMVELGGEVLCAGLKPDGSPWQIGIEQPGHGVTPAGQMAVHAIVPLRDAALVTSGSYRRFLESGGARRHHILDPRTGFNAESTVVSVSVVASDCALADALATTLMIAGPGPAEAILARFDDPKLQVLFLLEEDGEVVSQGVRWSFP